MTAPRVTRLSELIKEEVGELIHDELKDPRIGFVTVTSAEVTPDTRHADIHLSILGTKEERDRSLAGINSAKGHLRRELGRRVRMKYLPELHFYLDLSAEHSARVGKILHKIEKRKGEPVAGDDEQTGE